MTPGDTLAFRVVAEGSEGTRAVSDEAELLWEPVISKSDEVIPRFNLYLDDDFTTPADVIQEITMIIVLYEGKSAEMVDYFRFEVGPVGST